MACVVSRPNGHKSVQFIDLDGKRQELRLGKVIDGHGESVCTKIETILASWVYRRLGRSLLSVANSGSRRSARTTLAPRAAKSSAVARPIPLLAPAIRATLPFMSGIQNLTCAAWRESSNVTTTRALMAMLSFAL